MTTTPAGCPSTSVLGKLLLGMVACLTVAGCMQGLEPEVHSRRGEGPGRREQPLALNPRQELALGRQAYQEILNQARVLPASHPDVRRVTRVGERIARAAQIEPLQREINLQVQGYRFEWEYNVLVEKQINAFCLPGGKIGVFAGLLRAVGDNDDQLATVLAHEIAHALAHHASERIARERRERGGFLKLAYNRFQESEADHIGLFLMTFAGYDPEQAVVFWRRMQTFSRTQLPEILSDHPSDARRIADMEEWVPRARGAKRAYDEGRIAPARRAAAAREREMLLRALTNAATGLQAGVVQRWVTGCRSGEPSRTGPSARGAY